MVSFVEISLWWCYSTLTLQYKSGHMQKNCHGYFNKTLFINAKFEFSISLTCHKILVFFRFFPSHLKYIKTKQNKTKPILTHGSKKASLISNWACMPDFIMELTNIMPRLASNLWQSSCLSASSLLLTFLQILVFQLSKISFYFCPFPPPCVWRVLYILGWPWTHDLPDLSSWVLRLWIYGIVPRQTWFFF